MNANVLSAKGLTSFSHSTKNFKILVVDDNLQNIQLLGNVLKTEGFSVGFATDGRQAIEVLQRSSDYDLVLLDIDMPVMNGFETCRIIRQDDHLSEIPIIFLTAFTDNEKIITGFMAGAQDYVTKPFNLNELLARVNTHLQLKFKSEQLKELNKTLELKVQERTAALTEANKKLARLDKAKNDFLILISHEMRTPLNGIVGLADLLKDTHSNPAQTEFIEYLVLSAQKLLKFSDSALLITHLQLKDFNLTTERHDPRKMMDSIIYSLSEFIQSKSIQLKQKFTSETILIPADKELIEVSIKSLLENAVKFSPSGGEIITSIGNDKNEVKISVTDNGPGFSEEALLQPFDAFNASDMAHHSDGFGLSLATVKLIMDIHKGRIEIRNDSHGAEVALFLPLE